MQNEDIRCGKMKQASVNAGKIDPSSVDEDVQDQTCLIFLLPGSFPSVPSVHPIKSSIDTVLTCFKAYARTLAAASRPVAKQPSVALSTFELIKLRGLEKRGLRPRAWGEDPPSAATASRTDASVDQQSDLALASKLGFQKEMLDLFLPTTTDANVPTR
ncbi:hypothetical protein BD413DRAFT_495988 [Trametes elegans]|nr:hypothetical protein BD413DRAFT_495988 [Trametes elegans]